MGAAEETDKHWNMFVANLTSWNWVTVPEWWKGWRDLCSQADNGVLWNSPFTFLKAQALVSFLLPSFTLYHFSLLSLCLLSLSFQFLSLFLHSFFFILSAPFLPFSYLSTIASFHPFLPSFSLILLVCLFLKKKRKTSSGSGTGSTQPREYNWGATW
jgi:hypothetical protein